VWTSVGKTDYDCIFSAYLANTKNFTHKQIMNELSLMYVVLLQSREG